MELGQDVALLDMHVDEGKWRDRGEERIEGEREREGGRERGR